MRQLGNGEYIFRSRGGTAVNPGNALKRYVRPAAQGLGLQIGGWHDFRHSLTTHLRRSGVHPKVISGILGHAKVNIALDTYDRATVEDFQQPLASLAGELLASASKTGAAA
jgi:integrase